MSIYISLGTIQQELSDYFSDLFDNIRFNISIKTDSITMTGYRNGKEYQYTFNQKVWDYEANTGRLHHYLENVRGSWYIK
ncbi:hypothetical protein [Mucilaginibacter kameinonensis]|uniref:hypothetical protein n=1 Tax=Mucilaginibacter kameinonensis TaxID=452286 RepID=UPI000EF80BF8|nr:hypothetical protein [Mucilaginibacter kameinonensis]